MGAIFPRLKLSKQVL